MPSRLANIGCKFRLVATEMGLIKGMRPRQHRSANTISTSTHQSADNPTDKNFWDKAQIISAFLASVMIAAIWLLKNSSLQKEQIMPPRDSRTSDANLDSCDRDGFNQRDAASSASTANTISTSTHQSADKPKEKDLWDKAQIISGFLASVVIAVVGLLINSSLQNAQISSSENISNAQIASSQNISKAQTEVARTNAEAQIELSKRSAEVQEHLQEGTLTSQLVASLAGTSALKKQIAIVALRRSVPPDMYQDVITIVVRSDTDPEVRKTALEQAATLQSAQPQIVQAIIDAAKDTSRPGEERKIATAAAQQIGVRSITPSNTSALVSSQGSQASYESEQTDGGVFTHFLIEGLSGAASRADRSIRLSELGGFVTQSVVEFTRGRQVPMVSVTGTEADPVIFGPDARFSKTVFIAVGNSKYHDPNLHLRYPALDAQRLSDVFKLHGALTYVAEDTTRANFWTIFRTGLGAADADSLLVFYYSGHAIADRDGMFWLLPVDGDPTAPAITGISTSEIKQRLTLTPARTRLLFIDTAFAGNLLESR